MEHDEDDLILPPELSKDDIPPVFFEVALVPAEHIAFMEVGWCFRIMAIDRFRGSRKIQADPMAWVGLR